MLSKMKKKFKSKFKKVFSEDKISSFNARHDNKKYGIKVEQFIEDDKYIVYVHDTFHNDTVIESFENEIEVTSLLNRLSTELAVNEYRREKDLEERLVKDLNRLTYLHKRGLNQMFKAYYLKMMFSVYLNKSIVNHINKYVEENFKDTANA
jgi:predicted DNA-binding transcriptional regulator